MGAEREAQKGRDMYIIIADLHCCMAETKAISHQLKKMFKNKQNDFYTWIQLVMGTVHRTRDTVKYLFAIFLLTLTIYTLEA